MKSNIFTDSPKVSKSSWHYKLHKLYSGDSYRMPKTQCSYFWVTLFRLITIPFWGVGAYIEYEDGKWMDVSENYRMTIITYLAIVCGYMITFFLIWSIFSRELPVYFGTFHALSIMMGGLLTTIIVLALLLGIGFSVWEDVLKDKWKKYKNNKRVEDESPKEPTLSLFGTLKGWMKDRKDKICRPIEYVD